jgi:O-antigen/teichoic acid export membrane protein
VSRANRFVGGVTLAYLSHALVTVVGLWLTPFFLHRVGQQDYGLWLVAAQMIGYLGLLDLGVVALVPRETAYAARRARDENAGDFLPTFVAHTVRLVLWQVPLVALVGAGIWFGIANSWEALRWPFGIVIATYLVTFPMRIPYAVLQGLQDLSFVGRAYIASWAVSTVLTVVLVVEGLGLYALAIGWAASQLILLSVCLHRLWRRFGYVLPHSVPALPLGAARTRIVQGLWVSVGQIGWVLLYATDLLIIGKFLGPAAVVPFALTCKLAAVLNNQPQMIMQVAVPALSELSIAANRKRFSDITIALSLILLMTSGGIACVVLLVNRAFVGWWVGPSQFLGTGLTVLLVLTMLLRHLNVAAAYAIYCLGYERQRSVTTVVEGLVTAASAAVLVQWVGPSGALLGGIAGVCIVSLPANALVLAREAGSALSDLARPLWPWFWRFASLAVAAALASPYVTSTGVGVFVAVSLFGLLYGAVMLPVALRPPLESYVRPRLESAWARILRVPQPEGGT